MKVLVFTSFYPNNIWPNHCVFTKERMSSFARIDACKVKVVAPVPYFPKIKIGWRWRFSQVLRHEKIEGIDVYHPRYFMTPKVGMAFYGLTMYLSVLSFVKKIQSEFDLIESHFVYPDGFAAVLLGRYFKKPVVVFAEGSDINLYSRFPIIRRLLRYTLNKADRVIAVSQALKDSIVQLDISEDKISVIPNGVHLSKFYPFPREEAQRKIELKNKTVILSVGSLTPNKGFDLLIKAVKILVEEFHKKNICLIIIGEGAFRRELEKLVSSHNLNRHVRLVGEVAHHELCLWYNAADLFCLASKREGWPNVLLESLACGVPVVATSVGGIPEIICSDKIGILTRRNEVEIAKSISYALSKSWEYDEITKYAGKYTWDLIALDVFKLYKSILK